jgi:methylthioribulose-1-phosphate dehydratase
VSHVIHAGRFAAAKGWVPATSGNFSVRVGASHMAITRSGCSKGELVESDVAVLPLDAPLPADASAEAGLHVARYLADPSIAAVFHVHSHAAVLISRLHAQKGAVHLQGWELQKAFAGVHTHEESVVVPVFDNSQYISALAGLAETSLASRVPAAYAPQPGVRTGAEQRRAPGYLLAGHGLYAWGGSVQDALRHLEAFDELFKLQLEWDRDKP